MTDRPAEGGLVAKTEGSNDSCGAVEAAPGGVAAATAGATATSGGNSNAGNKKDIPKSSTTTNGNSNKNSNDEDVHDTSEEAGAPGESGLQAMTNIFGLPSSKKLTSRYRGVCWNKKNKRWQAAINSSGRYLYLGSYLLEDDAAKAFDKAALKIRGLKAKLNFEIKEYLDEDGNVVEDERLNAILELHERLTHQRALQAEASPQGHAVGLLYPDGLLHTFPPGMGFFSPNAGADEALLAQLAAAQQQEWLMAAAAAAPPAVYLRDADAVAVAGGGNSAAAAFGQKRQQQHKQQQQPQPQPQHAGIIAEAPPGFFYAAAPGEKTPSGGKQSTPQPQATQAQVQHAAPVPPPKLRVPRPTLLEDDVGLASTNARALPPSATAPAPTARLPSAGGSTGRRGPTESAWSPPMTSSSAALMAAGGGRAPPTSSPPAQGGDGRAGTGQGGSSAGGGGVTAAPRAPSPLGAAAAPPPSAEKSGSRGIPISKIQQLLPSGTHLECIFPGVGGAFGVQYRDSGSPPHGAGVWDGWNWHELGFFDSERDARQACQSTLAVVASMLARSPRVHVGTPVSATPTTPASEAAPGQQPPQAPRHTTSSVQVSPQQRVRQAAQPLPHPVSVGGLAPQALQVKGDGTAQRHLSLERSRSPPELSLPRTVGAAVYVPMAANKASQSPGAGGAHKHGTTILKNRAASLEEKDLKAAHDGPAVAHMPVRAVAGSTVSAPPPPRGLNLQSSSQSPRSASGGGPRDKAQGAAVRAGSASDGVDGKPQGAGARGPAYYMAGEQAPRGKHGSPGSGALDGDRERKQRAVLNLSRDEADRPAHCSSPLVAGMAHQPLVPIFNSKIVLNGNGFSAIGPRKRAGGESAWHDASMDAQAKKRRDVGTLAD